MCGESVHLDGRESPLWEEVAGDQAVGDGAQGQVGLLGVVLKKFDNQMKLV